jgi:DNA-binding CsgD family transcriptional regulator
MAGVCHDKIIWHTIQRTGGRFVVNVGTTAIPAVPAQPVPQTTAQPTGPVEPARTNGRPAGPTPGEDEIARTYALLLQHPDLDLAAVADRLGRDESVVRTVLDQLVELALIQRWPSESGELVAASPVLAMQQLLAREHELLRERRDNLERSYLTLSTVLSGYVAEASARDRTAETLLLEDAAAVRRCLQEYAVAAQEEVMAFAPRVDHSAATDAASGPLEWTLRDRGKRLRTVYPHAVAEDPHALAEALELVDRGVVVRTVMRLPMWLVIIDRKVALVPKDPSTGIEGGLLVRHTGTVQALIELFEAIWDRAQPLRRGARPDERSDTERMVLHLLATGAKDEAVARQLGQSVRTVRRIVADLMAELGAASRFELAVKAISSGWLRP